MNKPTIACLGPSGSFSENTLIKTLGHQAINIKLAADLRDLLIALENHTVNYIWLPWWNSGCGFLQDSKQQEFFLTVGHSKDNYIIIADDFTHLKFSLLGLPNAPLQDIKTILTNPYAQAICKEFFSDYSYLNIIIKNSSSEAAKEVAHKKDPTMAAVANLQSAKLYGLDVLKETMLAPQEEAVMHFVLLTHRQTVNTLIIKGDYYITSCIIQNAHKNELLERSDLDIHALRNSLADPTLSLLDLNGQLEEANLKKILGRQFVRYLGCYLRTRK